MRSMPQALMWEMMARGRWTLPGFFLMGSLVPLLVYAALYSIAADVSGPEFIVLQFAFIPVVVMQFAAGVLSAQGAMSRMFSLPVSANMIAAWHVLSGAVLMAIQAALTAWLFNSLFQVRWPIWGIALFAAVAWPAFLFFVSVANHQSLLGVVFAGVPGLLLCLWFGSRYGWFSPARHYWDEVSGIELATLTAAFIGLYALTIKSIESARCGERLMPASGLSRWLMRFWEGFQVASDRVRFRSPAQAQLWFEWRQKGAPLPAATAFLLLVGGVLAIVAWYQSQAIDCLFNELLALGGFLSLLAVVAGIIMGMDDHGAPSDQRQRQVAETLSETRTTGLGSFLGSRPVTNGQFAAAMLKTAALSVLISWSLWLVVYLGYVFILWQYAQLPTSFAPRGMALFPLMALLGAWVAMTNVATLGMTGRGRKFVTAIIGLLTTYGLLMGVLSFTELLSEPKLAELHYVCTSIACLAIMLGTVMAFRHAVRRRLIQVPVVVAAGGAFLLLGVSGLWFFADQHWTATPMSLAVSALSVLPLAAMPAAIAWNRHR